MHKLLIIIMGVTCIEWRKYISYNLYYLGYNLVLKGGLMYMIKWVIFVVWLGINKANFIK